MLDTHKVNAWPDACCVRMQDPSFVQLCASRWTELRSGAWSDASINATLGSVQTSLLPAGLRDFAR